MVSTRIIQNYFYLACLFFTTAGSCSRSPMRMKVFAANIGRNKEHCNTWVLSSIIHTSTVRFDKTGWPEPRQVTAKIFWKNTQFLYIIKMNNMLQEKYVYKIANSKVKS